MTDQSVTDWLQRDEGGRIADEMVVVPPAALRRLSAEIVQSVGPPHDAAVPLVGKKVVSADVLLSLRLTFAAYLLRELVEIDPGRAQGAPVLVGTRFKVSRIIAELADGKSVGWLARNFDLDKDKIVELLHGIAIRLDRPFI